MISGWPRTTTIVILDKDLPMVETTARMAATRRPLRLVTNESD
jgi:hypothetical protein